MYDNFYPIILHAGNMPTKRQSLNVFMAICDGMIVVACGRCWNIPLLNFGLYFQKQKGINIGTLQTAY